MRRPFPTLLSSLLVAAGACGDSEGEGAGTTTVGTTSDDATTTGSVWTTGEDDDERPLEPECSVVTNDCSTGKCTVISTAQNEIEYTCVPVLGEDRPGELCDEVANEPGHDSCVAGSVCMGVDAGTKRCVAFCGPGDACGEDLTCVRTHPSEPYGEGMPLCLRECNPLLAPCEDGWA